MNTKRGQIEIPIITFVILVVALLIMAPFVLKIINSILTPFSSSVGNVTAQAGTNVSFIKDTFVNFWDFVLLCAFLINVILLLVSAFLVDTHPVFIIFYILSGIFLFSFAPGINDVIDKIYNDPRFALEVSQLPIMDFIRQYLGLILLGIFIISGIIMYAKIRGGSSNQ